MVRACSSSAVIDRDKTRATIEVALFGQPLHFWATGLFICGTI